MHYLADPIPTRSATARASACGLHYLHEPELLGSAGAVKQLESFFDDTFVVVGCDDLTDVDLDALVAFHSSAARSRRSRSSTADDVDQYGVVVTDARGRIVEFQEKPAKGTESSKLVNTGIYVFEPEIFEHIPAATFYDFGKNVFPALHATGADFYGLHLADTYWRDIGTPPEYRAANDDVLTGRLRLPRRRALNGVTERRRARERRPHRRRRAHRREREVGAGARIVGPTVIGERCPHRRRCRRSSARSSGTPRRSASGAVVIDSIVGIDFDVPADTSLIDRIVANEPIAS